MTRTRHLVQPDRGGCVRTLAPDSLGPPTNVQALWHPTGGRPARWSRRQPPASPQHPMPAVSEGRLACLGTATYRRTVAVVRAQGESGANQGEHHETTGDRGTCRRADRRRGAGGGRRRTATDHAARRRTRRRTEAAREGAGDDGRAGQGAHRRDEQPAEEPGPHPPSGARAAHRRPAVEEPVRRDQVDRALPHHDQAPAQEPGQARARDRRPRPEDQPEAAGEQARRQVRRRHRAGDGRDRHPERAEERRDGHQPQGEPARGGRGHQEQGRPPLDRARRPGHRRSAAAGPAGDPDRFVHDRRARGRGDRDRRLGR